MLGIRFLSNSALVLSSLFSTQAMAVPVPQIKHLNSVNEGSFTRHYFQVENWQQFPEYLFSPAPQLPPCGLNRNASRTWVDIYNAQTSQRLYGFCAFNSPEYLQGLWVAQRDEGCLVIKIIMTDRQLNRRYHSNAISLPCVVN
jgi:hypothetical protein